MDLVLVIFEVWMKSPFSKDFISYNLKVMMAGGYNAGYGGGDMGMAMAMNQNMGMNIGMMNMNPNYFLFMGTSLSLQGRLDSLGD